MPAPESLSLKLSSEKQCVLNCPHSDSQLLWECGFWIMSKVLSPLRSPAFPPLFPRPTLFHGGVNTIWRRHWDIKWRTLAGKALPSRHLCILFDGLETPWPALAFSLLRAGKVWASVGCVRICWKVPSTAVPGSRCWLCSVPWEHNQSISLASGWPQLGLFPLTLRPGTEHGASESITVRRDWAQSLWVHHSESCGWCVCPPASHQLRCGHRAPRAPTQAAPALGSVPKYTGQDRSCHARVYITTALLLLRPCDPDRADTVQKHGFAHGGQWLQASFPSCSTVCAVRAMAGGGGEGMGEKGCWDRWERPWPLSVATGGGLWDSLAAFGIFGLWEHTRSLCGLRVGDAVPCPQ